MSYHTRVAVLAVVMALLLVASHHVEAQLAVSKGRCPSGFPTTFSITSATANSEAAAFLASQGVSEAIFDGMASDGVAYSSDGASLRWQPSSFSPPSTGSWFLTVKSDGGWSTTANYNWIYSWFLCTDGASATTTTTTTTTSTTTSTTVAPHNTTTTTTSTPQTTTTTTTTSKPATTTTTTTTSTTMAPVTSLSAVLSAVQKAVSDSGDIHIASGTANTIAVAAPEETVTYLEKLRTQGGGVQLGLGECNASSAKYIAAIRPTSSASQYALEFELPLDVTEGSTTGSPFSLCVTGFDGTAATKASSSFLMSSTSLYVHSLDEILSNLDVTVELNQGDLSSTHWKPLRVAGTGTLATHTELFVPSAFGDLTFSVVNNGKNGMRCTPSTRAVEYAASGPYLYVAMIAEYAQQTDGGKKSLCAHIGSTSVVVANLTLATPAFRTTQASFAYATPVPVWMTGISRNVLATGDFSAFLSPSKNCYSAGVRADLIVVSAATTSKSDPDFLVVANLTDGKSPSRYLCVTYETSSSRTYPVQFESSTASVSGVASSTTAPALTVFSGMTGSVVLADYVTPASATVTGDQSAHDAVTTLLRSATLYVRFVPLVLSSLTTASEKQSACRSTAAGELTVSALTGVLDIQAPLKLRRTAGVLCADSTYLRVDYRVLDPATWISTFGDTESFSSFTFALSTQQTFDASVVQVSAQDYGDFAIRLSADGTCTYGYATRLATLSSGGAAFSYPSTTTGNYTLCAGISNGATSAFASTGQTLAFARHTEALVKWKEDSGVLSEEWRPCGALAVCGATSSQAAMEVCSGSSTAFWPERLVDELNFLGAFEVTLSGNSAKANAMLLDNRVFVSLTEAAQHCRLMNLVRMTADGESYSTSVAVTETYPVAFLASTEFFQGVQVGLVNWGDSCTTSKVVHQGIVAAWSGGAAIGFDLTDLFHRGVDGYFSVCVYTGSTWRASRNTYVQVVPLASLLSTTIEAIGTADPMSNEDSISVWTTQTATWSLIGTFSPNSAATLLLVWNDKTCSATPAFEAPVQVISSISGSVEVDSSQIAAAPSTSGATAFLWACYRTSASGATMMPLKLEVYRQRSILLKSLTLSSINYLPHYTVSATATADTTFHLTDPRNPPITSLAVFKASAVVDGVPQAQTDCSLANNDMVDVLPVTTDDLGLRSAVLPATLVAGVADSGENVFLTLCATASEEENPKYSLVSAYILVSASTSSTPMSRVALALRFLPLNSTTDVVDEAVGCEALQNYAVSHSSTTKNAVLVVEKSANTFVLYMDTSITGDPAASITETSAVYEAMKSLKDIPLFVHNQVNVTSWFALFSVEGFILDGAPSEVYFPYVELPTSKSTTVELNGTKTSIMLFSIVVAPSLIGVVAFSLQRSIPTLNHDKEDKKETFEEAGDSPPPRDPAANTAEFKDASANSGATTTATTTEAGANTTTKVAVSEISEKRPSAVRAETQPALSSRMPLSVEPNAEDTTANPLYVSDDDDDSHGEGNMGASPPVRNDTFAMNRKGDNRHSLDEL